MKKFQTIGVAIKPNSDEAKQTARVLLQLLLKHKCKVLVDSKSSFLMDESIKTQITSAAIDEIGKAADLVIVVGGDGSMLNVARSIVASNTPVLGINRGGLGFLTDISPSQVEEQVEKVFSGKFTTEKRFLLSASISRNQEKINYGNALNDCVLYSGDIARLIEFEIYINDCFVCSQRSDGLITATPTGSTAYALSGGGPILQPWLNAFVLVPMFPHTLTSRPIVIDSSSKLKLVVKSGSNHYPMLSLDGQVHMSCAPEDEITIARDKNELTLIHPEGYDYYNLLRQKLSWSAKPNRVE